MSIEFTLLAEDDVVVITAAGLVSEEEVLAMRRQSAQMLADTGIQNYYVDLTALLSLAEGRTVKAFELGETFADVQFPYTTRTAVRLPDDPHAREQAKFLHTVELNRGRGVLRYVDSLDDAMAWFRS